MATILKIEKESVAKNLGRSFKKAFFGPVVLSVFGAVSCLSVFFMGYLQSSERVQAPYLTPAMANEPKSGVASPIADQALRIMAAVIAHKRIRGEPPSSLEAVADEFTEGIEGLLAPKTTASSKNTNWELDGESLFYNNPDAATCESFGTPLSVVEPDKGLPGMYCVLRPEGLALVFRKTPVSVEAPGFAYIEATGGVEDGLLAWQLEVSFTKHCSEEATFSQEIYLGPEQEGAYRRAICVPAFEREVTAFRKTLALLPRSTGLLEASGQGLHKPWHIAVSAGFCSPGVAMVLAKSVVGYPARVPPIKCS